MVTYILTKFGADWLIFVDASVVDGHRMAGQTPTDGE